MFFAKEIYSIVFEFFLPILFSIIMSIWFYIKSIIFSPTLTLVFVDGYDSGASNLIYDDAKVYLSNKIYDATEDPPRINIGSSTKRVKRVCVSKTSRKERKFTVAIDNGEEIVDTFQKNPEDPQVQLKWRFVSKTKQETAYLQGHTEKRSYELTFKKEFVNMVFNSYLPHILEEANTINEKMKIVKLYNAFTRDGRRSSVDLEHPATFETLAMDPKLKQEIKDDLERFKSRKQFYKKVGKPWRRGYLLYGPPGTGKSSLIAAMANYLKFDIYDLELTSISCNSDLRKVLLRTQNRSIVVIEDINRSIEPSGANNSKFTLSGLLNFIDGLWSSCGDERIIVFTANDKDQLDPTLLRPGRVDKLINMSYCTKDGFKLLAYKYLGIEDGDSHELYGEIEGIIESKKVTPAEVASKLMTSEEVDDNLKKLAEFLESKQVESNEIEDERIDKIEDQKAEEVERE